MARRFRLDFVPLTRERFDVVVYRRAYFEPPFQRFVKFCESPAFAAKAGELGGYDISGLGTVRYNGP
jgi:molybdate-binding protein